MLLLTLAYNGELIRCSTRTEALEHQWHGFVSAIDPVQIRSNRSYGGWLRVSLPTITFTPELFDQESGLISTFPPPRQIPAFLNATGSNEAGAFSLCSGVLSLKNFTEKGAEYELYSSPYIPIPSIGQSLAVQYSYDNAAWHNVYQDGDRFLRVSLDGGANYAPGVQYLMPGGTSLASWASSAHLVTGFFTDLCAVLGLTLDSSLASIDDPVISGTVSGDTLILDVADAVAAYFNHYFYINGSTLQLIDASAENGTGYSFGYFDYCRTPRYTYQAPVNSVYDDSGKIAFIGNTLYGQRVLVGASYYAVDNTYLQKIASYLELPQVELAAMELYGEFRCGRHLLWIDDRHPLDLFGDMVMRAVQYTFLSAADKITVIGEATFSI
jgi:hypothetical protein